MNLDDYTHNRFEKKTFSRYAASPQPHGEGPRRLYDALARRGYCEHDICSATELPSLQEISLEHIPFLAAHVLPDTELGGLIRLFLLCQPVEIESPSDMLGSELLELLSELGVLLEAEGRVLSQISIYAVGEVLLAIDHRFPAVLWPVDLHFGDLVMFIGGDSLSLVHSTPRRGGARVLDLCTGSGIQAILASRWAGEVTGVDISPRALRFARFNADFNSCRGLSFVEGNLYEPVAGETFDLICANPPFVPTSSEEEPLLYRYGGHDGAAILRRAARDLERGGRCAGCGADLEQLALHPGGRAAWCGRDLAAGARPSADALGDAARARARPARCRTRACGPRRAAGRRRSRGAGPGARARGAGRT